MIQIKLSNRKVFSVFICGILFVAASLFVKYLYAINTIKECDSPDNLIRHLYSNNNINSSTLIFFDIDDTLLISKEQALRATALDNLINMICAKLNCSVQEALSLIDYSLWRMKDNLGSGLIVDENLRQLLNHLKRKGAKSVALSKVSTGTIKFNIPSLEINQSLPTTYEERRFHDLKNNGIDFSSFFSKEFVNKTGILIPSKKLGNKGKISNPIYWKGVLLTGEFSKGETVSAFLDQLNWKPDYIIFIDNNLQHLYSVKEVAKQLSIRYEGIHFTYVNNLSLSFPLEYLHRIAEYICFEIKWPNPNKWLS